MLLISPSVLASAAAGAGEWGRGFEDGPAALPAGFHLFPEHPSNHRPASGGAAWAGAGAGPAAYHLEGLGAGLDRFSYNPFANFVAQANGAVGINDSLFSGLLKFVR